MNENSISEFTEISNDVGSLLNPISQFFRSKFRLLTMQKEVSNDFRS